MSTSSADVAAITVLCAGAMSKIIRELGDAFDRPTGIKVAAEFTRSGVVKDRIRNGEAVDVAITTQAAIAGLAGRRKVLPDSTAVVARFGIGVAIKAGRAKPNIGSVEAFKRALRDAQLIAYADPATGSPSANYLIGFFDWLGMMAELQSKTRLVGAGGATPWLSWRLSPRAKRSSALSKSLKFCTWQGSSLLDRCRAPAVLDGVFGRGRIRGGERGIGAALRQLYHLGGGEAGHRGERYGAGLMPALVVSSPSANRMARAS